METTTTEIEIPAPLNIEETEARLALTESAYYHIQATLRGHLMQTEMPQPVIEDDLAQEDRENFWRWTQAIDALIARRYGMEWSWHNGYWIKTTIKTMNEVVRILESSRDESDDRSTKSKTTRAITNLNAKIVEATERAEQAYDRAVRNIREQYETAKNFNPDQGKYSIKVQPSRWRSNEIIVSLMEGDSEYSRGDVEIEVQSEFTEDYKVKTEIKVERRWQSIVGEQAFSTPHEAINATGEALLNWAKESATEQAEDYKRMIPALEDAIKRIEEQEAQ